MNAITKQCPRCSAQMTLEPDPLCTDEWAQKIAGWVICNRCFDTLNEKHLAYDQLNAVCRRLVSYAQAVNSYEQSGRAIEAPQPPKNSVFELLGSGVEHFKRWCAASFSLTRYPNMDLVRDIRESPAELGTILNAYIGACRKLNQSPEAPFLNAQTPQEAF